MSYGQPCRSTTAGPVAGPASAYPIFSRPASICLSEANEVLLPGLIAGTSAGFILLDCAFAEPNIASLAAARLMAALRKRRRRSWLMVSGMHFSRYQVQEAALAFLPLCDRERKKAAQPSSDQVVD